MMAPSSHAPGRNRWHLLAAGDNHQELIGPDKRDGWPCADGSADQAMAQAVGDVRGQRRDDAQPSSHRANAGTRKPLRAESSITIELA
jgi:hypothetical protein